MANYCIMRFQKHKKSSIAKVERHQNDREHLKNRAHPERQNKTIKRYQDETMLQTVKRLQQEQEKRTGRKVRKDAVALVEIVLTFSPEAEEHIKAIHQTRQQYERKMAKLIDDVLGDKPTPPRAEPIRSSIADEVLR